MSSRTKSRKRSKTRSHSSKHVVGIAVFQDSVVKGEILLKESGRSTTITANLSGLKPNRQYAWHIHEAGDLRSHGKKKCMGACSHYNPFHEVHGGLRSKHRHVGDLGNITTNSKGQSTTKVRTSSVKLKGKYSVIGRSMVIHEKPDDLGKGGTEESLKTGSAGARIGCAVIGYAKDSKLYF